MHWHCLRWCTQDTDDNNKNKREREKVVFIYQYDRLSLK